MRRPRTPPAAVLASLLGLATIALALTAAHQASALLLDGTAATFTGDPFEVSLTVDDAAQPGALVITLSVSGPDSIGDLRGFFAQVADERLLSGLSVSGPEVMQASFLANGIQGVGPGNNLNGGGSPCPCDLGVEFGSPGIGRDDLQSVTFVLSHATVSLDASFLADQRFGVRVTSVGDDFAREGSSKLRGQIAVIPEPGTALLMGLGLAGLTAASRRPR